MTAPTKLQAFLSQPNRDTTLPYIDPYGTQLWYDLKGMHHRDNDLPAAIYPTGSKIWFKHGDCHRDGGLPAIMDFDGSLGWYNTGRRHRIDGPAAIDRQGSEYYFLLGKEFTYERWLVKRALFLPKPTSRYKRIPLL